jgi:serine/threonine protein kinase
MDNVQNGKFNFTNKVWANVSPDAKDLINGLLERDVAKRFSAEQALNHKWMTDYNAGSLASGKFGK